MAKKKETDITDINIEEAYSKTEKFVNDNSLIMTIVIGAIFVVIGGYFGWSRFYVEPLEKEAQGVIFKAQIYFEKDSMSLALEGDGDNMGFLDIIDEYKYTKAANLSKYYAGICYMKQGEFETAIDYLKSFSVNDEIVSSLALGLIGDAYMELGQTEKGISFYNKAANENSNDFSAPIFLMKKALALEQEERYEEAIEVYERIKSDYPDSPEGQQIEMFITRVTSKNANQS
ncbi:MAG: tetratricopeptide repeat protein [Bacteroidetes bacterium]|nr:tetratricopeptide repeat protein [Bacteroidota bacterium]